MLTTKHVLAFAAATFAFAGSAIAADVPARIDAQACKGEYPRASLVNEEQGRVSMSFLVSSSGEVKDSRVDQSSGYKSLDRAALRSVTHHCRFKPGTKDGAPADTWTKVDYAWKLD